MVACMQVSPGMWHEAGPVPYDFSVGYAYAIASSSSIIMTMYQVRGSGGCRNSNDSCNSLVATSLSPCTTLWSWPPSFYSF